LYCASRILRRRSRLSTVVQQELDPPIALCCPGDVVVRCGRDSIGRYALKCVVNLSSYARKRSGHRSRGTKERAKVPLGSDSGDELSRPEYVAEVVGPPIQLGAMFG
jgi:hypothetical protein